MKHLLKIMILLLFLSESAILLAQMEEKVSPKFYFETKADIPLIILPDVNTKKLLREDKQLKNDGLKKVRFAKMIEVDIDTEYNGLWKTLDNGDRAWIVKIKSPKAYSVGIVFDMFELPEGAQLFIYSTDKKDIRGAFTHKNNKPEKVLAIAPVKGDEIVIEYYEPKDVRFKGHLHINSVAHDYKNVFAYLEKSDKGYGDSGDCNVNINCPDGNDWQEVKHAVCKIIYSGWLCSGALINNTRQDAYPYFLTANHCINNQFDASTAVFYFNYESNDCNGAAPIDLQTISGSNLIATPSTKSLDFSLLKLSSAPPPEYKPYYAGWSRDVANPTKVTSIHHPSGDIKKISISNSGATTSNYEEDYTEFSHWLIKSWDVGTTEGGSSGSPLFNENAQIIGDLTGGDATCSYNYNDYYAQFHRSWNEFKDNKEQLKHWLDPLNSNVVSINGYKPYDTIPTNIKILLTDTIANIKWNHVADTANVESYLIYRNGIKIDSCKINSYTDTLNNDSVYYYQIGAKLKIPAFIGDRKSDKKYVRPMQSLPVPFYENFETYDYVPPHWYEERSNDTIGWQFLTGRNDAHLDTAYEGTRNAFFTNNNKEVSKLVLPKLDLSGVSHAILTFYLHNEERFGDINHLNIYYKSNDSTDWKLIKSLNTEYLTWTKISIPINDLSDEYQIAFEGIGYRGLGICIDSILVQEDNKYIVPEITSNKSILCLNDTILFSTSLGQSFLLEWDFGNDAKPRYATGAGPHKVTYSKQGIKPVSLSVDKTYVNEYYDVATVYESPVPEFIQLGNTLISNSDYGNQWFLNNNAIPNANGKSYTVEEDGDYSLEVTNSFGCSEISENKYIVVNNIEDIPISNNNLKPLKVYPNPNNGYFTIEIDRAVLHNNVDYIVSDITGKVIAKGKVYEDQSEQSISLPEIVEGIYLIKLYNKSGIYTSKLLIKK